MNIAELLEAFDFKKKEKGEVAFKKSSIDDPHIISAIQKISIKTGVPFHVIRDEILNSRTLPYFEEVKKYSPLLYDTIAQNSIENATFAHIGESVNLKNISLSDIKFDWRIFNKLLALIKQDNSQMWPLKAPGEDKFIYDITPIFVPTKKPELMHFNDIKTAAVNANGDFIFNKDFMQQLIDYAAAAGIVPKKAKYESNGGSIPDCYAYIEFLIMHEVFHYKFGDFATGNKYSQYQATAHNWAMDLRSNYILVKNGYEQLPTGLFSDDLNFDREHTKSYGRLIKIVNAEMQKLPKHLRRWLEKEFKSDEHEDPPKRPPLQIGMKVKSKTTGKIGTVVRINDDGTAVVNVDKE